MEGRMKSNIALEKVSIKTDRKELIWVKGKKEEFSVYRIPKQHLYFNIENGRYADKMIQLRADNPGVDIDPKEEKWKKEILSMLEGEYTTLEGAGTESDKVAFQRLRDDIINRTQLKPGVVLADGGVIDGNRRLAVFISLHEPQFSYFEGVILPEDIPATDRWGIEVGIQMGKDQQLDYSAINKLLKIRQGLELFKSIQLPIGETPESMVVKSLYGVDKKEIESSIERINLIDEYLAFFKILGQYHRVSANSEQFIEAVNVLKAAESKLKEHEKSKLKSQLFVIIRENLMSNWDIRDFSRALGGRSKSPGRKSKPIEKAINHFVEHSTDPTKIRDAYTENKSATLIEKTKTICSEFQNIFEAEKQSNQPLILVKDARIKMETLKESLKSFKKDEDEPMIKKELIEIKKLVKACHNTLHNVKKNKKK
jgi:hypothetical protein